MAWAISGALFVVVVVLIVRLRQADRDLVTLTLENAALKMIIDVDKVRRRV